MEHINMLEALIAALIVIGGGYAHAEHPEATAAAKAKVSTQVQKVVSSEANAETGLTDVTVVGKTFSLDVQPLDYSKLND